MKKLILLIFALALVLSLAACGGKSTSGTDNNSNPPAGTAGNLTTGNNSADNSGDLTTVPGFLSYWGLSEADLKCANYTRLDKTAYDMDTKEISEVGVFVSKKLTDEEIRAWLDQVMTKLNALSENGKIERSLSNGETLTVDYMMGATLHIGQGKYQYKGKTVSVLIAVPNDLDSSNPNEAQPACSIKLESD